MTTLTNEDISKLKAMISRGQEDDALKLLLTIAESTDHYNRVCLISNQYFSLKRKETLGLPYDQKERNQVLLNAIEIIDTLNQQTTNYEIPDETIQELTSTFKQGTNIILWNKKKRYFLVGGSALSILTIVFFGSNALVIFSLLLFSAFYIKNLFNK